MSRVLYVKQHARWITKIESDFQVQILKSIWQNNIEDQNHQARIIFDKFTLHTFEEYYLTQKTCVDYESLELLNRQTGVTKKQIKGWFANRRRRGSRSLPP
jgi:hypothetical protein